jgi:D-amino-acid dehydrogenase
VEIVQPASHQCEAQLAQIFLVRGIHRQYSPLSRNTIFTVDLAIQARQILFDIANQENLEFGLEKRGIMHVYHDKEAFDHAVEVNKLLAEGGLDRKVVTPAEMRAIEPALTHDYYGGMFTPDDSTGDIHGFTRGLAEVCLRKGVHFLYETDVLDVCPQGQGLDLLFRHGKTGQPEHLAIDGVVLCAGAGSRRLAAKLGDRLNIYPVKGYSITVNLLDAESRQAAPWVSLLDDKNKVVSSRLSEDQLRIAGTAEFNGLNYDIRADRIRPLLDWVRRELPAIETSSAVPWTGLRPMLPDLHP